MQSSRDASVKHVLELAAGTRVSGLIASLDTGNFDKFFDGYNSFIARGLASPSCWKVCRAVIHKEGGLWFIWDIFYNVWLPHVLMDEKKVSFAFCFNVFTSKSLLKRVK